MLNFLWETFLLDVEGRLKILEQDWNEIQPHFSLLSTHFRKIITCSVTTPFIKLKFTIFYHFPEIGENGKLTWEAIEPETYVTRNKLLFTIPPFSSKKILREKLI